MSWLLSIYNGVTNFLKNTFQDRFKRYLIISLIILGIVIGFTSHGTSTAGEGYKVYFFYLPSCSHCEAQEPFNEKLESEYSQINITRYDATTPAGSALLDRMLEDLRIEDEPAFPITIFGNQVFSWESEDTTGIAIEEALQQCLAGNCPPPTG